MASMRLVDTHSHLEDLANLDEALIRAEEAGVSAVVAMGIDYESDIWVLKEGVKHQHSGLKVCPAVGLHPWGLNPSKADTTIRFIEQNAHKVVALGEVGLDYWYKEVRKNPESKDLQKQVYRRLLEIAKENDKPVSVHSRGAWTDCVNITVESGVKKAVFHWFTGSSDDLKRLLDQGYYVSATPAAAYSKEHRATIENAPLERIMLETDSPVLYKGEPADPSHVLKALVAVAELKKEKQEKVAEATTENAETVFGIR